MQRRLIVFVIAWLILPVLLAPAHAQTVGDCGGLSPSPVVGASAVRVLPGETLGLRLTPALSDEPFVDIPPYAVLDILDSAPACADGLRWWYVGYPSSEEPGWVAEGKGTDARLEPYIIPELISLVLPEDTADLEVIDVAHNGITFSVDRALAAGVGVRAIRPNYIGIGDASPAAGTPTPDGLVFTFFDENFEPLLLKLTVYALADFEKLPDGLPPQIAVLQALNESPSAEALADWDVIGTRGLLLPEPLMPVMFQGGLRPLTFQNGKGVGYFAAYSFFADPVFSATYIFAGLTDDGLYYVTLQVPVTGELFSAYEVDMSDAEAMDAFYDGYDEYIAALIADLATAATNDFTPDLTNVNTLIESLDIQTAGAGD